MLDISWPIKDRRFTTNNEFETWFFSQFRMIQTTTSVFIGDCSEWGNGRTAKGYGRVAVAKRDYYTHRLMWIIKNGPIKPNALIRHRCDNPPCGRLDHLLEGDKRSNAADAVERGLIHMGENHYKARLTEANVKTIRNDITQDPGRVQRLAATYGVSQITIYDVLRGRTWKHLL